MRKEVIAILLAVVALTLAGCQSTSKTPGSGSSTPFFGGNEGLKVSFVENAPPSEVLDNPTPGDKTKAMRFDIVLRAENVGEQDVAASGAKVTIGGLYPSDFDKKDSELQNVVFGKTLSGIRKDPEGDKIPGSIEEKTFKDLAYIRSLEGNNRFPIQADVCYRYTTKAVGDFCMRQDVTKGTSGVCAVKGTKQVFSSGAPVHVVSLDESVGGRTKVILRFKIKADGTGSFFIPEAIGTSNDKGCEKGNFAKENFVKVTVRSGVTGLECSGLSGSPPTGNVRLSNGEASVTCFQSNVNVDAVQKLNIELEYNHLISTSISLLVKHLPTDDSFSSGSSGSGSASGTSGTSAPAAPAPPSSSTIPGLKISASNAAVAYIEYATGSYPTAAAASLKALCDSVKGTFTPEVTDATLKWYVTCMCPTGWKWNSDITKCV